MTSTFPFHVEYVDPQGEAMGAYDPTNPGYRWRIHQIEHIDFF